MYGYGDFDGPGFPASGGELVRRTGDSLPFGATLRGSQAGAGGGLCPPQRQPTFKSRCSDPESRNDRQIRCAPHASDGLSENTECHVKPARQPIPAARMVHVRSHGRAPVDLACGWRADRRRGLGPPRVDPHDVGRAQRPRLPRLPNDVHPAERREETAVDPWMAGLPGHRGPVLDADGQGSFVMGPDVGSRQARRIRIASA